MVIFIPGVYSGPINFLFNTYFKPQFEYLSDLKIEYQMGNTNSEHLMQHNANRLFDQISGLQTQVTVVTHSKGGIDFLELVRVYPEVKKKVKKVIIMQAPFYGSPVADLLTTTWWGKLFIRFSLTILNGHKDCLAEIRTDVRKEYMKNIDINKILEDLDIHIVSSYKKPDQENKFDTCLFLFRNWMFKKGMLSDGLVPYESSKLEGFEVSTFDNLDHASAVVVRTPLKVDFKKFNDFIFSHLK